MCYNAIMLAGRWEDIKGGRLMSHQTGERVAAIILVPICYNPDKRGERKKVERD